MKGKSINPVHKSLVVGLGGTGKRVLVQLKKRMLEAGYADSSLQKDLRLVCIDFDPAEETTRVKQNTHGTVGLAATEIRSLDAEMIQNRINTIQEPHNLIYFQEWYPDITGELVRIGSHRSGAAQWRPLGRMGYFEYVDRIHPFLLRTMNLLLEVDIKKEAVESSGQVVVYLISSLAGGTGSGIMLDTAYFFRQMPLTIRQIGLFLLPSIYAEFDLSGRLFANTYASLKELTAFANQSQPFQARYPNGAQVNVAAQEAAPFDLIFLYDNIIGTDRLSTNADLIASIMAENIFLDFEEARLRQTQESVLTNIRAQAGAGDSDTLSGKCVFNTMGTLTLLLPSQKNMREFYGRKYLNELLVPSMLSMHEKWTAKDKAASSHEDTGIVAFPEVEKFIDDTLIETIKSYKDWDETFITQAGASLANDILKNISSPDSIIKDLERWLGQFLTPRHDGEFDSQPSRLPDVLLDGSGYLRESTAKLTNYLTSAIDEKISAGNGRKAATAEQLMLYLKSKADILRGRTAGPTIELKDLIGKEDTPVAELKNELMELLEAKPWQLISRMAVEHWARRYLRQLDRYYQKYARDIRINTLFANAIDTLRQEKLLDDNTLLNLMERSTQIKERLPRLLEQAQGHLSEFESVALRSLANSNFWDKAWKEASAIFDKNGSTLEFIFYLDEKDGLIAKKGEITTDRLMERTLEFSEHKVEALLKTKSADFLMELFSFVDQKLFKEELSNVRNDFMFTNVMENRNERNIVYATSPAYSDASDKSKGGEYYNLLWGLLTNSLEASMLILDTYSAEDMLKAEEPGRIIVRHVSLNHPASNLKKIRDYYYAYTRYTQGRKLLHADKRFVDFSEIIVPSQEENYPVCGNPKCDFDISDVLPQQILCPGCGRPIKSRCGNVGCPENQLHKHEDMQGANPSKFCPVCGNLAKTYWWWCGRHNVYNSTQSKYCLKCLAEYDAGIIDDFRMISNRDESLPYIKCPGCLADNLDDEAFKIDFLRVYDQVRDRDIDEAFEIYHTQTRRGYCPKCGAQLLPFCPYCDPVSDPHFIQRVSIEFKPDAPISLESSQKDRFFFCTTEQDHSQKCIAECSYCNLPLRDDATYCPRCKRNAKDYEPSDKDAKEYVEIKKKEQRMIWFGEEKREDQKRRCEDLERKASEQLEKIQEKRGDQAEEESQSTLPKPTQEQLAEFDKGKKEEEDDASSP